MIFALQFISCFSFDRLLKVLSLTSKPVIQDYSSGYLVCSLY